MTDHLDVIAAFADGEHVEGDALKAALADEAGREYLVDLLALRGLVSEAPAQRAAVIEPPKRAAAWRLTTGSARSRCRLPSLATRAGRCCRR